MQIIYSDAYKKDYKKIIKNKHLHKEELRIENIKNVIISSENLHQLLLHPYAMIYGIEQKKGNMKEIVTARVNQKIRLYMKPLGEYPYKFALIEKIEFIKIDDKHYGEG